MNILSIQSEVVFGHVGQEAARPALMALGHEVWAVPTVLLSSHAGRSSAAGEAVSAALMARLIGGLEGGGSLADCGAVLSGYLGSADQAGVVARAVQTVRRANPKALYCLDPVFGDNGRAYAKHGVAEAMARLLLPLADIVTPNAFELASLTSVPVRDPDEALAAARRLGRPLVLATSVPDGAKIGTLAVTAEEQVFVAAPALENVPHGAGDLLAALFLGRYLCGETMRGSLEGASASVYAMLAESVLLGVDEMPLVANWNWLSDPPPL